MVVEEGSVIRLRGKELINGWGLAGKCAYVMAIRLRDGYLDWGHRIKLLPLKNIYVSNETGVTKTITSNCRMVQFP